MQYNYRAVIINRQTDVRPSVVWAPRLARVVCTRVYRLLISFSYFFLFFSAVHKSRPAVFRVFENKIIIIRRHSPGHVIPKVVPVILSTAANAAAAAVL